MLNQMRCVRTALPVLLVMVMVAGTSNSAMAAGSYGAIALSPTTHGNGYGFGFSSAEAARQIAVGECEKYSGSGDCMSVVTLQDGCGVLAAGSDAYGTGVASDRNSATAAAMDNCQAYSNAKDCKVLRWICR